MRPRTQFVGLIRQMLDTMLGCNKNEFFSGKTEVHEEYVLAKVLSLQRKTGLS